MHTDVSMLIAHRKLLLLILAVDQMPGCTSFMFGWARINIATVWQRPQHEHLRLAGGGHFSGFEGA